MAYKLDENLEFLQYIDSESLQMLVDTLTKDKDGVERLTESLTNNTKYKMHYPNHSKYWEVIAEEIQSFGGNTFINIFRKGGVLYKEILCDVCDKMNVNYNKKSNVSLIEQNLFMKIFEDSVNKMSEEDLKIIVEELKLKTDSYTSQAVIIAMQVAIKKSGFMAYKMAAIIVNAVLKVLIGRGLSFAATGTMMRSISIFAGPIGWIFVGIWTALDIAGPAYRVTIPSVIEVAFLRLQYLNKNTEEEFNNE